MQLTLALVAAFAASAIATPGATKASGAKEPKASKTSTKNAMSSKPTDSPSEAATLLLCNMLQNLLR
ncbi:hypothetical protein BSLG_001138 [Batrachochytrium salamandrivorans]|nr:hypothetical protein BSLG_001138 [Batrachochytrium salamandrivorans]